MITFVARVRALLSDEPAALDPRAAEHQLRSALGDTPGTPLPSPAARARAQVLLLGALTQSLGLDEPTLAALRQQARQLASYTLPAGR